MTDQQLIDAVQWCYDNRSESVTSLAAWHRLYDLDQTDTGAFVAVGKRLNGLAREGKLRRHKMHGSRHTFYRPAGTPLPLFTHLYR